MSNSEIKICSIEHCTGQVLAKGWCGQHYRINYKYGDPLATPWRKPRNSLVVTGACKVDGCPRNEKLRQGLCSLHYERVRRTGEVGPVHRMYDTVTRESKFWEKVDKSAGEDGCWPWTGAMQKVSASFKGYGEFYFQGKTRISHRVSYELSFDVSLTSAEPIHHKCGNSTCQNPKHLQKTTNRENNAEMLERNYYIKRIAELEMLLASCSCSSK